jgi:hypothetical protein
MQWYYDGQIRRYLTQTIRILSNFTVKYGDGTLVRIPVMYGDPDRQAASIIRQNSENAVNSVPRMAVYIAGLDLDKDRLGDSSYVGKVHVRERDINGDVYTTGQGRNYTVERLMPTPFKLTIKCDIWSANADQKLQILEQILVLFNPSLELQTSDNYLDWTSLSVLNLSNVLWSSRTVPVGAETPIDIASLTFETPIWISPPAKVKHLGVITKIITSIYDGAGKDNNTYIDGLGHPLVGPETTLSTVLSRQVVTISDYTIQVYNNQAVLLNKSESSNPREPTLDIPVKLGDFINWEDVFSRYPGKYVAGSSMLFLTQPNGTEVIGTVAINPADPTILTVSWDKDTLNSNTGIDSQGNLDSDPEYNQLTNYRENSPGTFDAIIDPTKVYPENGMTDLKPGDRFLIVDDIGGVDNRTYKENDDSDVYQPGVKAWGTLAANANDIIEWTGSTWNVVFNSAQESDTLLYQTNIYTGVQYVWNGVQWAKAFEGEYKAGEWRLEL